MYNEDKAMRAQLLGIIVFDGNAGVNGREVAVHSLSPEDEVVSFTPPIIIVSMPEISIASDHEFRGPVRLPYAPTELQAVSLSTGVSSQIAPWWPAGDTGYDPEDSPYVCEAPIPYWLDYTITVYTRIARQHLYPIMAELEQDDRLGRMAALRVPEDGTFRRLTRMGGPYRDFVQDENGKRLFTASYRVRVPTEVITGQITDTRDGGSAGFASDIGITYAFGQTGNSPITLGAPYNEGGLNAVGTEANGAHVSRAVISWVTQHR